MGKSDKIISEFQLEGRFLGFILKDGYKPKTLRLETATREYWIKLPKSLREEVLRDKLYDRLKPGDRIYATGESVLSLKNGTVKLIADEIQWPNSDRLEPIPVESSNPANPCRQKKKCRILVCEKSDCRKRGAAKIAIALQDQLDELGLSDRVQIKKTGCMSRCKHAPNVVVMPDKTRYSRLGPEEIPELIEKHFAPVAPIS